MKKIAITIICVGLFVTGLGMLGHFEHRYTLENCEITRIENGLVIATDKVGHEWAFYDEGFEIGEKVNLKMFDSCTGTMEDDIIERVERVD